MRFFPDIWEGEIKKECQEKNQVLHDMNLVLQATKLYIGDSGWEDLRLGCITEKAKEAIDHIERIRYREDEYLSDMM